MNEMYTLSLSIHSIGTVLLLIIFSLNIISLLLTSNIKKLQRFNSIILLPLTSFGIGIAVFTGVIMMAAKHLTFTLENIVMILLSMVLIFLEFKRHKTLKYLSVKEVNILQTYKKFAFKILYTEILLSFLLALWMWTQ